MADCHCMLIWCIFPKFGKCQTVSHTESASQKSTICQSQLFIYTQSIMMLRKRKTIKNNNNNKIKNNNIVSQEDEGNILMSFKLNWETNLFCD